MKYQQKQKVAWSQLGEKIAIIQVGEERYFHELNPTASEIWLSLKQPATALDIYQHLNSQFKNLPSSISEEIEQCISDLKERGLIEAI